jgi:hypothetical protein
MHIKSLTSLRAIIVNVIFLFHCKIHLFFSSGISFLMILGNRSPKILLFAFSLAAISSLNASIENSYMFTLRTAIYIGNTSPQSDHKRHDA